MFDFADRGVVVTGAAGRMGSRIIALARADERFDVVAALETAGHPSIDRIWRPPHERESSGRRPSARSSSSGTTWAWSSGWETTKGRTRPWR